MLFIQFIMWKMLHIFRDNPSGIILENYKLRYIWENIIKCEDALLELQLLSNDIVVNNTFTKLPDLYSAYKHVNFIKEINHIKDRCSLNFI